MKRLFMIITAFSCVLCMSAQSIKKNEIDKQIEDCRKEVETLKKKKQNLLGKNEKTKNRRFERVITEPNLKIKLSSYNDVKDLVENNIFEKEPDFKSFPIYKYYLMIINMYKSLSESGGYSLEENETYKKEFENIKDIVSNLSPQHKRSFIQSFDELAICIEDYQYTMFELARIFELVNKKIKGGVRDNIYNTLQNEGETVFIDKIPYTKAQLKSYIEDEMARAEIIGRLSRSCPEAFEKLK